MKKIGLALLLAGVLVTSFASWWLLESIGVGGFNKMSANYSEAVMFMSMIPFSQSAAIFTCIIGITAIISGMKLGGIQFLSKITVEKQLDKWFDNMEAELENRLDERSKSLNECLLKPTKWR